MSNWRLFALLGVAGTAGLSYANPRSRPGPARWGSATRTAKFVLPKGRPAHQVTIRLPRSRSLGMFTGALPEKKLK